MHILSPVTETCHSRIGRIVEEMIMIYFHESYEAEFGFELAPLDLQSDALLTAPWSLAQADWCRASGYLKKHADLRHVPGKNSNMINHLACSCIDVGATLYKRHVPAGQGLQIRDPTLLTTGQSISLAEDTGHKSEHDTIIWATPLENISLDICPQWRFRSACVSAYSRSLISILTWRI